MASSYRQTTSPYDSKSTNNKNNPINTYPKYNNNQPNHLDGPSSDDEIKGYYNKNQKKSYPNRPTNTNNNGGSPRKGFNANFNSDKTPASPRKEKFRSDKKEKCLSDEKENESNSVLYICTNCVVGPHACSHENDCKYVEKHNCESKVCCKNDDERRSKDIIKKKGFIQTVKTLKTEQILPKNETLRMLHGTSSRKLINGDFVRHIHEMLEDGKNRDSPETVYHMHPDRKTRTLIRDNTISDVPCKFCITGSCTVIKNRTNEDFIDDIYRFIKVHNSQKEKAPNILKFTHIFGPYKPWSTTEMLGFILRRDEMKKTIAARQQQTFDDQFKEMSLKIKNQQELESSRLDDIVANDPTIYN
jgi:hypothetical protein